MASTSSLDSVLAARIRSARRSMPLENHRKVSQQSLADRVGVHVITVSQWERGKARPTIDNLAAIADATGKPMSFFMGEGDDDEEDEQAMRAIVLKLVEREQYDIAETTLALVRGMKARRETRGMS